MRKVFTVKLLLALLWVFLGITEGRAQMSVDEYKAQQECKIGAYRRFREGFDPSLFIYQIHFNSKMNRCFLWVYSVDGARTQYLLDVKQKQPYGVMLNPKDGEFSCRIMNGACNSRAEWEAVVKSCLLD